jgi:hypothetical protein
MIDDRTLGCLAMEARHHDFCRRRSRRGPDYVAVTAVTALGAVIGWRINVLALSIVSRVKAAAVVRLRSAHSRRRP